MFTSGLGTRPPSLAALYFNLLFAKKLNFSLHIIQLILTVGLYIYLLIIFFKETLLFIVLWTTLSPYIIQNSHSEVIYLLFYLYGYGFCHNFLKLFHNNFVDFHFAGVILVVNVLHFVCLALYLNELINLLRFSNLFAMFNNCTPGDAVLFCIIP